MPESASPAITASFSLRNGRFIATAPDGTIGVGATADEAWQDLMGEIGGTSSYRSPFTNFVAKTAVVTAAIVGGLVLIAVLIGDVVATGATRLGESLDLKKIEHELARAADPKNDFPPEQKERLVRQIRAIVARARPILDELSPLFCAPPR